MLLLPNATKVDMVRYALSSRGATARGYPIRAGGIPPLAWVPFPPSNEGGLIEASRDCSIIFRWAGFPPSNEGGLIEAVGRFPGSAYSSLLSALE